MIATAVTFAFFAMVATTLTTMIRRDADKIAAALGGNSWLAERIGARRPIRVRYDPRLVSVMPTRCQPALRAAA